MQWRHCWQARGKKSLSKNSADVSGRSYVEQFETVVALLKVRVSEIAALQWDDFDFEKNQLSFSAA